MESALALWISDWKQEQHPLERKHPLRESAEIIPVVPERRLTEGTEEL